MSKRGGHLYCKLLENARSVGIYASTDKGKTFEYIREEAEPDAE